MEQQIRNDLLITIQGLEMSSLTQFEIHRGQWRVSLSRELDGTIHITATPHQQKSRRWNRNRSTAARSRRFKRPRQAFPMPLPPFPWLRVGCLNLTEVE
ncbi:MAG TPA: hypothetical protein PLQ88_26670, partial [Blastocatellia bacterium]|nr:hypothetical protein [Blastocatellia bacterium]